MTIDDKLNLIALLKAVRPYINTTIHNAESAYDNEEGNKYYHISVIKEAENVLDRIGKSIAVLMEN